MLRVVDINSADLHITGNSQVCTYRGFAAKVIRYKDYRRIIVNFEVPYISNPNLIERFFKTVLELPEAYPIETPEG